MTNFYYFVIDITGPLKEVEFIYNQINSLSLIDNTKFIYKNTSSIFILNGEFNFKYITKYEYESIHNYLDYSKSFPNVTFKIASIRMSLTDHIMIYTFKNGKLLQRNTDNNSNITNYFL